MFDVIIISVIILIGFIVVYFVLKHRILKIVNPLALVNEIKKEIDQVLVELNRTTESNIGLLEDKINVISELLSKADKRIMLLQRETEKFSLGKNYTNILKKTVKKSAGETVPPPDNNTEIGSQAKVLLLHEEGFDKGIIAAKLNMNIGEVELIISLNEAENVKSNL